ncbi:MAG: hypothetical protein R3263_06670 [Myxococcota bacterium]|nr:hypothetical protein [Myxococcota bacterium]
MARIVGDLRPEDDFPHELGPEPNFNESMYFNFFDPRRRLGGWMRLGNRANEGHAEVSVCLYLPDGRVLFQFQRPGIRDNAAFDAGGLRVQVEEPGQRLRTTFRGRAVELAEPRAMADPRRAFRENPLREVAFDLVHDAVGPMYGHAGSRREASRSAEKQFAKAHYEQHMHVTGTLTIGDERFEVDGYGLRDHSWGPRFWQAIHRYEWLTLNFGPDLGAMVSVIQRDPDGEEVTKGGVLVRGDRVERLVDAEIDATYEENGLYHRTVRARVRTAGGEELVIDGRVHSFIPLRNRREGRVTHIGEGMTEWTLEGRTGWGLSEFLRQVQ